MPRKWVSVPDWPSAAPGRGGSSSPSAGRALCVMVLLLGASVTTALQVRDDRVVALTPNQDAPNSAAPAGRHLFEANQFSQT